MRPASTASSCCSEIDAIANVFATAARRDASNRDEVVETVGAAAGMRPQFLTGEVEGRLTYLAVHRCYGWSANRVLLIDIGGGSMEIVLGRDAEPDLAVSLPLGAGRLTCTFLADDPPTRAQLKVLRQHIRHTVREGHRPGAPGGAYRPGRSRPRRPPSSSPASPAAHRSAKGRSFDGH